MKKTDLQDTDLAELGDEVDEEAIGEDRQHNINSHDGDDDEVMMDGDDNGWMNELTAEELDMLERMTRPVWLALFKV